MRCKRIVLIVNWLELWWLLEKPAFQEVASGKKFQLPDHNWFSCESVDARDLKTFSWNCRPVVLAASADGSMLHHL